MTGCSAMLRAHGEELRCCSTAESGHYALCNKSDRSIITSDVESLFTRNQPNKSDCVTFIYEINNVLFNQFSNILTSTYICFTLSFIKGKENGITIIRALIIYTLYYVFMCMHWLKNVRLNTKDRLKISLVRHWKSPC